MPEKPIEAHWQKFCSKFKDKVDKDELARLRELFFCGALAMYTIINKEEDVEKIVDVLADELEAFGEAVVKDG